MLKYLSSLFRDYKCKATGCASEAMCLAQAWKWYIYGILAFVVLAAIGVSTYMILEAKKGSRDRSGKNRGAQSSSGLKNMPKKHD